MANIFGRVVHAITSAVIPNAQVTATAPNVSKSATTGTDGKYTISDVAPGNYTVNVKATGFVAAFLSPLAAPVVTVGPVDVEFNLTMDAVSVTGRVTDANDAPVSISRVKATNAINLRESFEALTDGHGKYEFLNLPAGIYTVQVLKADGTPDPDYVAARNVAVVLGATAEGIDFSRNVVKDFLGRLDDARFSIETQISLEEANQAVALFSVVNLLLAGLSRHRSVSEERERIDVMAILELYDGLRGGSLKAKITVSDDALLWNSLETELTQLAKDLDQLQNDVNFLSQEAKRQFNLGTSNNVLANVEFPPLFKRYVEIAADPMLSIDILKEESNAYFDKAKLAQAYDLLRELKGLILQIVRSLSKYGTAATKSVNENWSRFEARALEVLSIVAQQRVTSDLDAKNIFSVLAELVNKNRETQVAPYVVLARHGGKMLNIAMETYLETQNQLDNFDQDHLRDLFQPQGKEFRTTRLRKEATLIKRYSLQNWG